MPSLTVETLVDKLRGGSLQELISGMEETPLWKGRAGEYLGAAWYLYRENNSKLQAYLLDRDSQASVPENVEAELGKEHTWFSKVRPQNDRTAQLFDVVIVEGTSLHALISCKWCTQVDEWFGIFRRKVNGWPEDQRNDFQRIPQFLFQVTPMESETENRTCRISPTGVDEPLDWQKEVEEDEEDEGKQRFCGWLKHLLPDNQRRDAPVRKRQPREWQIAACRAILGHLSISAPQKSLLAGDIVAATGSGKTDVIMTTLEICFKVLSTRDSRDGKYVVLIETLEGAGNLQAGMGHLDANVSFLNSSRNGGGDYKDDRVTKIDVTCDSTSGWVKRNDPKTEDAITKFQKMDTADRPCVIVCLYQSAHILLQLQCLARTKPFKAVIMDEVHSVARSESRRAACHYLPTSHLVLGLTATAVPSGYRVPSGSRAGDMLEIDAEQCQNMGITMSTEALQQRSAVANGTQVNTVWSRDEYLGDGLQIVDRPLCTSRQYKALLGFMAKIFHKCGAWLGAPYCFRPAEVSFRRSEWDGAVLEGGTYLWQAGDNLWIPVPRSSEISGLTLQLQAESSRAQRRGMAAQVTDQHGQTRWVIGDQQSMRDWLRTNLTDGGNETRYVPPPDFGTYLLGLESETFCEDRDENINVDVTISSDREVDNHSSDIDLEDGDISLGVRSAGRQEPYFYAQPFQRPVLFALSKGQSDALGYTVPPVIEVTYMDTSSLEDESLRKKLEEVKESNQVLLPSGTSFSPKDFYNAQALRKRFSGGGCNSYEKYGNSPSRHTLVQCPTNCEDVDRVHFLLKHVFQGLVVDGEEVVVEKAHSKNRLTDDSIPAARNNRKALKLFKRSRFGVLVVCEMFVQGSDFPELDEVFRWNGSFDKKVSVVQLGGRACRKKGRKKEYGVIVPIQYLQDNTDREGDDGDMTIENIFKALTSDGIQLYHHLADAFGKNVKMNVRYMKKRRRTSGNGGGTNGDDNDDDHGDDNNGVDHGDDDDHFGNFDVSTFTDIDIERLEEILGYERYNGSKFWDDLVKWEAEMLDHEETRGLWRRSEDGSKPPGVINRYSTLPYQKEVSEKVFTMLHKRKTRYDWDADQNKDARTFHNFVSEKLGWDFESEWQARKAQHEEERANPSEEETFDEILEKWEAEMLTKDLWKRSEDGSRPLGVTNRGSVLHYQEKVSKKVNKMLGKQKTQHAWEADQNKDARTFHHFVSEKLGWDFKSEWQARKAQHEEERANPREEETFDEILEKWEAEMLDHEETRGLWRRSEDGSRPPGVINANSALQYQNKVSGRYYAMRSKSKTQYAWEADQNKDARTFHNFVSEKLGWNFESEWKAKKADHDRKETFNDKLEKWKAEMMTKDSWKRSEDGFRPPGVINREANALPYQKKVSTKVDTMLDKRKPKHDWDAKQNKDAHTFHKFVYNELSWDFESEWKARKAQQDEERKSGAVRKRKNNDGEAGPSGTKSRTRDKA